MADDIVFELLHSEIINYALDQSKENENKKVGFVPVPVSPVMYWATF